MRRNLALERKLYTRGEWQNGAAWREVITVPASTSRASQNMRMQCTMGHLIGVLFCVCGSASRACTLMWTLVYSTARALCNGRRDLSSILYAIGVVRSTVYSRQVERSEVKRDGDADADGRGCPVVWPVGQPLCIATLWLSEHPKKRVEKNGVRVVLSQCWSRRRRAAAKGNGRALQSANRTNPGPPPCAGRVPVCGCAPTTPRPA